MAIVVDAEGVAERIEPNREVMEQWVEALESGEYPQTTGTLQRTEPSWNGAPVGFCCLGVLCDLAVKQGVTSVVSVAENGTVNFDDDGTLESGELPRSVLEWAGLVHSNPFVDFELTDDEVSDAYLYTEDYENIEDVPRTERETLAELNDGKGRDFKEIARIIRQNFLS